MTLVVVNRKGNWVSFASDSRISFPDQGYLDIGIKVFSNPTKVSSMTDGETNMSTVDYSYRVGLAVIGGSINSFLVKDTIYELLQNVQHGSIRNEFSFEEVAKLVHKVYARTTKDLDFLRDASLCTVLLAGYCQIDKRVRLFKFEPYMSDDEIWTTRYSEFLIADGVEFFGSGKKKAIELYNLNPNFTPLKILREVIKDKDVPSVGGGMQYGDFLKNNFRILGVEDYELDENGKFKDYLYTLRGLNLYKDELDYLDCELHINYPILRAFKKEIDELVFCEYRNT